MAATVLICQKCGWEWERRVAGRDPVECPNCKSRKWKEERTKADHNAPGEWEED